MGLPPSEEDALIELSCNRSLRQVFSQCPLAHFWARSLSAEKALGRLLPFPTTFLCGAAFSALVHIKLKTRSRMDVEPDLRLRLSSIDPDVSTLGSDIHHHLSH
ncbi:unnamed protein product [Ixodes hexagonus]